MSQARRLGQLEDRARERTAAIQTAKEEQAGRAFYALSWADQEAYDALGVCFADSARLAALRRLKAFGGADSALPHLAAGAAWAWTEALEDSVAQPWPAPPAGQAEPFAAYFMAEAARADRAARIFVLTPDLLIYAAGAAALWRFDAALMGVLLEDSRGQA